jgi:hypothetical protein
MQHTHTQQRIVWFRHDRDGGAHKRCPVVSVDGDWLEVRFSDGVSEWIPGSAVFREEFE